MDHKVIGIDLAKSVFQIHVIDAFENVVTKKQIKRSQMVIRAKRKSGLAKGCGCHGQQECQNLMGRDDQRHCL